MPLFCSGSIFLEDQPHIHHLLPREKRAQTAEPGNRSQLWVSLPDLLARPCGTFLILGKINRTRTWFEAQGLAVRAQLIQKGFVQQGELPPYPITGASFRARPASGASRAARWRSPDSEVNPLEHSANPPSSSMIHPSRFKATPASWRKDRERSSGYVF
jgi:hypothetical protein